MIALWSQLREDEGSSYLGSTVVLSMIMSYYPTLYHRAACPSGHCRTMRRWSWAALMPPLIFYFELVLPRHLPFHNRCTKSSLPTGDPTPLPTPHLVSPAYKREPRVSPHLHQVDSCPQFAIFLLQSLPHRAPPRRHLTLFTDGTVQPPHHPVVPGAA
jgi:hypothetical protein